MIESRGAGTEKRSTSLVGQERANANALSNDMLVVPVAPYCSQFGIVTHKFIVCLSSAISYRTFLSISQSSKMTLPFHLQTMLLQATSFSLVQDNAKSHGNVCVVENGDLNSSVHSNNSRRREELRWGHDSALNNSQLVIRAHLPRRSSSNSASYADSRWGSEPSSPMSLSAMAAYINTVTIKTPPSSPDSSCNNKSKIKGDYAPKPLKRRSSSSSNSLLSALAA
jgi:hypothetical protein